MSAELLWVDVVVAYALLHGNVEWPTTWIEGEQSAPGLFMSREEVFAAAASQHIDGSVFYLREVPSVCLRTSTEMHVIADYVNERPFSGLDVALFARQLKTGTPIGLVLAALRPGSDCWVTRPAPTSLLHMSLESDTVVTAARSRRLSDWSSFEVPWGLAWVQEPSRLNRTSVYAIRDAFQRVNALTPEVAASARVLPSRKSEGSSYRPMRVAERTRVQAEPVVERHWEDELLGAVSVALGRVKRYFGFNA